MNKEKFFRGFVLIVIFIIISLSVAKALPYAVDWHGAYRPGTLLFLQGKSPYDASGYIYPPWTSLLLIPFAIFPESIGRGMLFSAYLFAIAYTAYKLGGGKISIALILASPPVMHGLLNGTIDAFVILGVILPPWLGLFLLVIKPQLTIGYIIYLLITTYKTGKISRVIRVFGPVFLAYMLSLIVFGLWPLKFTDAVGLRQNASLWPLSIPIGLVLLAASFRKDNLRLALAASPFMSPYVLLHSWISAFLALAPRPLETAAAVIGMWLVVFIQWRG
jgi:hypothetical protein